MRARFASTTRGNPIRYRWESAVCGGNFHPIDEASGERDDAKPGEQIVLPRRRTWFVGGLDACAVRLVVLGTNAGVPELEDLEVVEGAANVLRAANGPPEALDGAYETGWTGEPGKGRWTLTARLAKPETIDRVRLVLGTDAVSIPREGRIGRDYSIARAPLAWTLEASEDGEIFFPIGHPTVAVRRPLVRVRMPRPVIAVRLSMEGATNEVGLPSPSASPMVREIEAYAEGDPRPIVAEPWVLSVNANPAASGHAGRGGEVANDVYFAKFLQMRFASLFPSMAKDDRYARALGPGGELVDTPRGASDGRALESIEADDAQLEERFLTASWPPPIAVLSGSNDWEYAHKTVALPKGKVRWNPLRPAREGGMGDLASAVKDRAVPFVGFCGGAQLLALLEAKTDDGIEEEIDAILRRNTGRFIRGFAKEDSLIRTWPGEGQPRRPVSFVIDDPLFVDLAGPSRRNRTFGFPESHLDMVRPESFLTGGPLENFEIVASSLFCSPAVVAALHSTKDPAGVHCARVTEVFRNKNGRWPIIGTQFHAEQRDFDRPAPGEPPESVADARIFVAAAYEQILDAYLR
ncbi:MAG: discoidin domain-containing protein [Polyangiales bacterium]